MKFISKHSNYRVVLRPGIPGNRMNGTQTIPGIYIKFEGGMVDVKNEEHIKMMLEHPAYLNGSFIIAPEDERDPYIASRENIEPKHNISEMVHGSVGKSITPRSAIKISKDQKKIIIESAKKMAIEMFMEMKKKDDENKMIQKETVVEKETIFKPKHPNLTAPEPEEDKNSIGGGQEENLSPVQVERVEADKVKVKLEEEDDTIIKAKHLPIDPNAPRRGRPRKTIEQNNK